MVGTRRKDWNTTPTASRRHSASASSLIVVRSAPATSTEPEVACSRPPMIIIMLDLPAPDGPTTPTDSPAATARLMPRRMLTSPAALASFRQTSSSRIIGTDGNGNPMNDDGHELPRRGAQPDQAGTSRRPYGAYRRIIKLCLVSLVLALAAPTGSRAADKPLKLLALGDSLTAGYGLPSDESFAAQLQAGLRAGGAAVSVINGGVSGDTSAGGLARLDWLLAEQPDCAIVELGANDGLRGLDPAVTFANLDALLTRL